MSKYLLIFAVKKEQAQLNAKDTLEDECKKTEPTAP